MAVAIIWVRGKHAIAKRARGYIVVVLLLLVIPDRIAHRLLLSQKKPADYGGGAGKGKVPTGKFEAVDVPKAMGVQPIR